MQPNRAFIEGSPQISASTPSQTSIGTTASAFLAANPKRKGLIIQNTGTTILKFTFGSTVPTQTVYHIALMACTAGDNGTGGTYFESSWVGPMNVISSGAGGTFVYAELAAGSPDWDRAGDWGTYGLR
jgi:hypothetical protein